MDIMAILTVIGGIMLSIIGFFLKRTMEELKEVKGVAYDTRAKVQVLENDYLNKIDTLNHRIDMLYNSIEKLTDKIDELNKRMK